MPSSPNRLQYGFLGLAVGVGLLVVATIIIAPRPVHEVRVARSTSGSVIRLEGYTFGAGTVRYDLPDGPLEKAIARVLPEVVG
jgi:hypothetical protein